jgi:hypothetical protein
VQGASRQNQRARAIPTARAKKSDNLGLADPNNRNGG